MADLAHVDSASGYQLGDFLLLRITGKKPSPCYIVSIELAPMDIFPPEFNATWAPDPLARCTEVVVPYEVAQAFRFGSAIEKVTLHAEGGPIEVPVETLPALEPGPVVVGITGTPAADIVMPPQEATGYSEGYDVGEAVRDAIDQLPERNPGIPDWLSTYTVVEIGVERGGIAGWNRLFARVRG